VRNGRKYARLVITAAHENVEKKKKQTQKAATLKRKGAPQTKHNKKQKDCTQLLFVSAVQKEGDRGVPTQTENRGKGVGG
jgi:hypothetical protein